MLIVRYLGASCFWIFSSEALVLIGNSAGYGVTQTAALMVLLASVLLYGVIAGEDSQRGRTYRKTADRGPGAKALVIIGFSGIIGTCLFVSTGILVSAGFTFNEVFWYRFPNFGFAFLLLVLTVVVHSLAEDKKDLLAGVLVCGAAGCIVLLELLGLILVPQSGDGIRGEAENGRVFWPLIFVFLGFERISEHSRVQRSSLAIGLFTLGLLLLLVWGGVSALLVAPEKLADSTIAHMLAAGKIAPPWGRYLMGAAVICGCLAALIQFFSISEEFLRSAGLLPPVPTFRRALPLLLGSVIAGLMFGGVAGSEKLEAMIRASLLLWLAYSGAKVVAWGTAGTERGGIAAPLYLSGGGVLAGCFAVFLFQGEYAYNFIFTMMFLVGSALCVAVIRAIQKAVLS